jgi:hypothetical protein
LIDENDHAGIFTISSLRTIYPHRSRN